MSLFPKPARVSVVIPTYNRRALLREAVESVLGQTYRDFELIVVDDGSTDGTAEAMRALPGVGYVRQDHRGVSAARNRGVRAGSGDLVAFLDSDDLWRPAKLERQVAFMDAHPEAQVCQTEEVWIRNGARVNPGARHRKTPDDLFARSLGLCLVSPSAVMMRRDLFERVGGFDESLPACEDYDLWLRVTADESVPLLPEPLVVKRGGHADQLSRRFWGMDRFRVAAIVRVLASGRLSAEKRRLALSALVTKCAILARGASKRGRIETASRYLEIAGACLDTFGPAAAAPTVAEANPVDWTSP